MIPNLGAPELIIALVVILLVFGANRLPKLARSLGEARRELRSAELEADDADA
jgi:sec-independent protein translocase protein TatA